MNAPISKILICCLAAIGALSLALGIQAEPEGVKRDEVITRRFADVPEPSAIKPAMMQAPPEVAAALAARAKAAAQSGAPAPSVAINATIFSEDFEGTFPGTNWLLKDFNLSDAVLWGKVTHRKASGSFSAYCAGAGPAGCDPAAGGGCTEDYYNNQNTWMIHGPFSLAGETVGGATYKYYTKIEANFDYFYAFASIDGTNFFGLQYTGDSSGFQSGSLDFTNVFVLGNIMGQPQVWFAFVFVSDTDVNDQGAYVDDLIISKGSAGPTPTPTPTPTPAGPTPTPTVTPTPSPSPTETPVPTPTPEPTPPGITKSFTIFNDGNGTLDVNQITKQGGAAWCEVVAPGPYPVKIQPQGSAQFQVNVYPHLVSDGVHNERLLVPSNDTQNSPVSDGVFITLTKGAVTVVTMQEAIDHIVGRVPLTGDKLTAADKNQNSKVDSGDVIIIINE